MPFENGSMLSSWLSLSFPFMSLSFDAFPGIMPLKLCCWSPGCHGVLTPANISVYSTKLSQEKISKGFQRENTWCREEEDGGFVLSSTFNNKAKSQMSSRKEEGLKQERYKKTKSWCAIGNTDEGGSV